MSRADAAAILERARALLAAESDRAESDQSDESVPEDPASVALIAWVAAPVHDADPTRSRLKALLDDYVAGAAGQTLNTGFASWAEAAGLTYANRRGVAVALDEQGCVVAAMDLNSHGGRPSTQRDRSTGRGVRRTHTHGFEQVNGTWTCVQDYYAIKFAPETGCGRTWDEADEL